jgi:hypothetical protein
MFLPMITDTLTKSEIKKQAEIAVNSILETGEIIPAVDLVSKLELFIKEIKADPRYIDYARDEVAKHGKAVVTASGTKIELAEVGTKYDYSQCGDPEIDELNEKINQLKVLLEARQDFLKKLPPSGIELRRGDELIWIMPPSKSSTSSIKTTISK